MLTLIFVVLKINGLIDWPWIWVFCPLWLSILVPIVIFVVSILWALIRAMISTMIEDIKMRREK